MPVFIVIVLLLAGAGYFGLDAYHNYCERRTGLRAGKGGNTTLQVRNPSPLAEQSPDEPLHFDVADHDTVKLAQHISVTELEHQQTEHLQFTREAPTHDAE